METVKTVKTAKTVKTVTAIIAASLFWAFGATIWALCCIDSQRRTGRVADAAITRLLVVEAQCKQQQALLDALSATNGASEHK